MGRTIYCVVAFGTGFWRLLAQIALGIKGYVALGHKLINALCDICEQ